MIFSLGTCPVCASLPLRAGSSPSLQAPPVLQMVQLPRTLHSDVNQGQWGWYVGGGGTSSSPFAFAETRENNCQESLHPQREKWKMVRLAAPCSALRHPFLHSLQNAASRFFFILTGVTITTTERNLQLAFKEPQGHFYWQVLRSHYM